MSFLLNLEKRSKSLFYGMEFTNGIRRQLVDALILIYFISLGHDVIAVTSMFAVSRVIMMLFEFPTGSFADYYSRKKSIIISFSLMAVAFFGIFMFSNFWLIALFFILHDIAWTFQSGTTTAWVVDTLAYQEDRFKLSSLFANFFFFEKAGAIVGGLIGLIVISINYRYVWLIISLSNILIVFIIIKYMEEKNFYQKKTKGHFIIKTYIHAKESLAYLLHKKNKQIKGLAITEFIGSTSASIFSIVTPLILLQVLNIPSDKISGLFAIISGIVLIAPFLGSKSVHRFGLRDSLFVGALGYAIFVIFFAISQLVILSIIILLIIHLIQTATVTVHDTAVQQIIPSKSRATLGSAMNIIWGIANASAAVLVSLGIAFTGLSITTIIGGILALITGFIYRLMIKS